MDKGKSIVMSRGGTSVYRIQTNDTIDRSKVRILLCDGDPESCQEVFTLLCKCSYQVTPVWSVADVPNALNIEVPCIDIILAEVHLLVANGARILKYIMQNIELRCIPLIILSTPDQVSLIAKCLRLGATDYLMKPLCDSELLNLWMHVQLRRRVHGASVLQLNTHGISPFWRSEENANSPVKEEHPINLVATDPPQA